MSGRSLGLYRRTVRDPDGCNCSCRISIFCMGYLVACFYFLLVGGDLLLKPVRSILVYWDCLIGYNVFVITMKNILSVGCWVTTPCSSSLWE